MFLTTISQTGAITLPHPEQEPAEIHELLEQDVIDVEAHRRLDLPGTPPEFDVATGLWASHTLFRCCQFLIFRDLGEDAVKHVLEKTPPRKADAVAAYSADIAFSILPDVFQLARGISPDDPLVQGMRELARQWPLSSVGIPLLDEVDPSAFIDHPCLRELYVERILQRRDRARIKHPAVRAAIRRAVGAYHELAPELMTAISQEEPK